MGAVRPTIHVKEPIFAAYHDGGRVPPASSLADHSTRLRQEQVKLDYSLEEEGILE